MTSIPLAGNLLSPGTSEIRRVPYFQPLSSLRRKSNGTRWNNKGMEVKCFNYAVIYYYFYIIYGPIGIGSSGIHAAFVRRTKRGEPFLTLGALAPIMEH